MAIHVFFHVLILVESSTGGSSHRAVNLCSRVVMGLRIVETTGGFQGAGFRLLVFLRGEPDVGALG